MYHTLILCFFWRIWNFSLFRNGAVATGFDGSSRPCVTLLPKALRWVLQRILRQVVDAGSRWWGGFCTKQPNQTTVFITNFFPYLEIILHWSWSTLFHREDEIVLYTGESCKANLGLHWDGSWGFFLGGWFAGSVWIWSIWIQERFLYLNSDSFQEDQLMALASANVPNFFLKRKTIIAMKNR